MSDRPKDGFLVEGTVEKPEAGRFIALYKVTPLDYRIVDSVEAKDGKFKFIGKVDQQQMFMLKLFGKQTSYFVAGNEDVTVDIKGDAPKAQVTVKAGEEQAKLQPVLDLFAKQGAEFQPMMYEYELSVQNRDMARAEKYRGMLERGSAFYKQRYKHLIDSLGPSFGAYTAATRLDLNNDFGTIDTLSQKISAKYPSESWAKDFAKLVADNRALATGQVAPDFSLPTPEGKSLGPSSFKGKFLVLDFWASWCKPCRVNSPQMVELYKKYKGRGVEILGVSLDQTKARWETAIADDGYAWPQVSELKMWDSEVVKQYKIEGIPHLVLLDKDGRIVGRGLTPEGVDQLLAGMTGGN